MFLFLTYPQQPILYGILEAKSSTMSKSVLVSIPTTRLKVRLRTPLFKSCDEGMERGW